MPKLIDEIITNYKKATGKEAKLSSVPAAPVKCLRKHDGQRAMLDEY
jgi:hypothetical protein